LPAVELVSVTVDEARRQNVSVYLRGLGSV
jgi:hypothetical protein